MVAAPYPPAEQAISCLQAAGPRAIAARWRLPVAEGHWRERRVAERYPVPHSFSLLTSQTHPAVGGLFFAAKGALAHRSDLSIAENCELATCRGRAGSDTLRDSARKTRILCNFIKLSPRSWPLHPVYASLAFPAGLGTARPRCLSYAPKIPTLWNFMRKLRRPVSKPGTSRNGEKTPGPGFRGCGKNPGGARVVPSAAKAFLFAIVYVRPKGRTLQKHWFLRGLQ